MKIALDIRYTADDQDSDFSRKQAARALGQAGSPMIEPLSPPERRTMVDHYHPKVNLSRKSSAPLRRLRPRRVRSFPLPA